MEDDAVREIVLKSPTGSGKTIMLTHFMDEYTKEHAKTVFVWLTPGKGDLETQSKDKMDKYIHNAQTKLLADVMTCGFEENDACFINWEKLTKKGNNALKDSERTNFLEWIEKALNTGLSFKIIIDESHQNFTDKADAIVQLFKTDKIIRCSATPLKNKKAKLIEIAEEDVIAEGLIKKLLVINENFPQTIETDNQTWYLLERALNKQREIKSIFLNKGIDVNPLIVVQLPNNSDALCDSVEEYFSAQGINIENETLAIWLSGKHENVENISDNDGKQIAVVMKQAVATGWDCPRAHILVKLRENMDETFEIQTIGRIRRMPEAKHYGNDVLDCCYLYTFDQKFTAGVKAAFGKGALDGKDIFLKNEYKSFTLTKEQRTMITDLRDPRKALSSIASYFKDTFGLTGNKKENKTRLETAGFVFSDSINTYTQSGSVATLSDLGESDNFNKITVKETVNTHKLGRANQHCVGLIAREIGIEPAMTHTILRRLFCDKNDYYNKFLTLSTRELYAFIINNVDLLRRNFREAMAEPFLQLALSPDMVSTKEFILPRVCKFTYDGASKVQTESVKNVYQGYLMSAEKRSTAEKKFEKFCEKSDSVDWIYKNGDKGDEYLSIVYLDNSDHQKLFYPDYIVSVNGETWIIETKGDFDKAGNSEDIDIFSPKKFEVLKAYLEKYGLKGGFVRFDKNSDELCICTEKYSDNINSDDWKLLDSVFA